MKRMFCLILALILVIPLFACGKTAESQPTESQPTESQPEEQPDVTLYVVTERRQYVDGVLDSQMFAAYDDKARPLTIQQEQIGVQTKECTFTYDTNGNCTQLATAITYAGRDETYQYLDEYRLTYTDGVLTHCDLPGKSSVGGVDLVYDDAGRLVVIQYDEEYSKMTSACWVCFAYDAQGRLVEETLCKRTPGNRQTPYFYYFTRVCYSYDASGKLSVYSLYSHNAEAQISPEEAAQIPFGEKPNDQVYFYYDQAGRLANVLNMPLENYDGSSANIYSNTAYSFDAHGNLVREDYGGGNYTEYTYIKFELTKKEAQLARRLSHGAQDELLNDFWLNPLQWRIAGGKAYTHPFGAQSLHPFYYLLPYAQWDVCEVAETPNTDQPDDSMRAIYLPAEERVSEHGETMSRWYTGAIYIYGGEGQLLYRETSSGGSVTAWKVETDEYGRIAKMYYESNGTTHIHEYSYDAQGNITQLDKYIGDHLVNRDVNTYDENGNLLTQEQWIDDEMTFIEYTYENGLLVLKTSSKDGMEMERVTYGYDIQSRLTTETIYSGDTVVQKLEYTYSEDGRTRWIEGLPMGNTRIETVDEHGNLIRVETVGSKSRTVREYTYHIIYVPQDYPRKN